jgi:hypothetical protein
MTRVSSDAIKVYAIWNDRNPHNIRHLGWPLRRCRSPCDAPSIHLLASRGDHSGACVFFVGERKLRIAVESWWSFAGQGPVSRRVYLLRIQGYTAGRLVRRARRVPDVYSSSPDRMAWIVLLPAGPTGWPLSQKTLESKKIGSSMPSTGEVRWAKSCTSGI